MEENNEKKETKFEQKIENASNNISTKMNNLSIPKRKKIFIIIMAILLILLLIQSLFIINKSFNTTLSNSEIEYKNKLDSLNMILDEIDANTKFLQELSTEDSITLLLNELIQ